ARPPARAPAGPPPPPPAPPPALRPRAAYDGARAALAQTPGQLAALGRAGVVDAGGCGLVAVLGALWQALSGQEPGQEPGRGGGGGRPPPPPPRAPRPRGGGVKQTHTPPHQ
ncbi:hypothetical protein ACFXPJ_20855, partial [Streptomyces goshikiensis]